MVIIGAGGLAKEVLQVLEETGLCEDVLFFDNVTPDCPSMLFDQYSILRTDKELHEYFTTKDKRFTLGLGLPRHRDFLYHKAIGFGGEVVEVIAESVNIGRHVTIGKGTTILGHVDISNGATIGNNVLIYYKCTITHDCKVGDFVELSPGATLLGHVQVGEYAQIGANATILPRVRIGKGAIVGAGAVVTKDVPDGQTVVGVPARIISK